MTISVSLQSIATYIIAGGVLIIGWFVRRIIVKVDDIDTKVTEMRIDFPKEYVLKRDNDVAHKELRQEIRGKE